MRAVALAAALVVTAAQHAGAEALASPDAMSSPPPRRDAPHDQLLGFRIDYGDLATSGRDLRWTGLAIVGEHRLAGRLRGLAEYTYAWVGIKDDERMNQDVIDGSGHRLQLGVRYTALESRKIFETIRFYADLEAGVGATYAWEPTRGDLVAPHAFAGLRIGYDFTRMNTGTRASTVWQPEVIGRVVTSPHGTITMFGIGFGWGE